jgi:hypothetical protein
VMAISALTVLFSEEERPKAVGIWAAANMVAFPVGPILGGWLLAHYWWGSVFLINVPVALVGMAAVSALVPESSSTERPGFDVVGLLASGAGLVALTYGFVASGYHGWGSPATIGPLVAGVVILAGFFAWEHTLGSRPGGRPLVDPSLFESASFTWGVILFALLTLALVGALFTLPQYFQGVVGTNPEGSGIRLLPIVGGLLAGVLPASVVAKRIGARPAVAAGFAVLGLPGDRCHHVRRLGRGLQCCMARGGGARHRAHHGDRGVHRFGGARRGACRDRLGGAPGAQEHRRAPRKRGAGRHPERRLHRAPAPRRRAPRGGWGRTPERLRGPRRPPRAALGVARGLGARCFRPRHGRHPRRVGGHRGGRYRGGARLPAVTTAPGGGISLDDASRRDGLRERKKARTRAAIQHEALRLFRSKATTSPPPSRSPRPRRSPRAPCFATSRPKKTSC